MKNFTQAAYKDLREMAQKGDKSAQKVIFHRALLAAKIEGILHHEDPLGVAEFSHTEYSGYAEELTERFAVYERIADSPDVPLNVIKLEIGNVLHIEPNQNEFVNRVAISIQRLV